MSRDKPTEIQRAGITYIIKKDYPCGIDPLQVIDTFAETVDLKATMIKNKSLAEPQKTKTSQSIKDKIDTKKELNIRNSTILKFFNIIGYEPFSNERFIFFIYDEEIASSYNASRTITLKYLSYMIDLGIVEETKKGVRTTYQFTRSINRSFLNSPTVFEGKDHKTITVKKTVEKKVFNTVTIEKLETRKVQYSFNEYIPFKTENIYYSQVYLDYYKMIFELMGYNKFSNGTIRKCFIKEYTTEYENRPVYTHLSAKNTVLYYMKFGIERGVIKCTGAGNATKYQFISDPNKWRLIGVQID